MSLFPTRIVVGVAEGQAAREALDAAVQLSKLSGSQLHLVHVKLDVPKLRSRPTSPPGRQAMAEEGEALLARLRSEVEQQGVEVAGTHVRAGDRVDRVLMHAQQELEAGLLVVGAGRSGAVGRRLAGRAALRTRPTAPGSVLVIRNPG